LEDSKDLSNQTLSVTKKEGEKSNLIQGKIQLVAKRISPGCHSSEEVLEVIAEEMARSWLDQWWQISISKFSRDLCFYLEGFIIQTSE